MRRSTTGRGDERRHPRSELRPPGPSARHSPPGSRRRRSSATGYRVLDVGCGPKPYYPFFAERATEYVGVDVVDDPGRRAASARSRSFPSSDGEFDLVLCTQVLEHCDDPAQAVRELRRVTAPGGRVLASTHGVQWYHPSPVDYWRWTHEGLRRLFATNADWGSLEVEPSGGTAACLAMLRRRLHGARRSAARTRRPLARGPVWLLNRAAAALDRRFPLLGEPRPGSLTANFHVVATV